MGAIDLDKVNEIVDSYGAEVGSLIQILLDVQRQYNWLPPETLRLIGERLDIPITRVYRVASFYKALSLVPRGEHIVKVCLGTACHLKGGVRLVESLERDLKVERGHTTQDLRFSLDTVNCVGACALAPVVVVDEAYQPNTNSRKLKKHLKKVGTD